MLTRRQFGLTLGSATVAGCAHSPYAPANTHWLTAEQVREDLELVEEAYNRIHLGYDRYTDGISMRAAWDALRQKNRRQGGMDLADLYLDVELILTKIRCDHTKAELPKRLRDAREAAPLYLPFRWELVEGRGFITFVAEGSPLGRGDEILEIDRIPLRKVVNLVSPFVPVDGFTEWAKRGGISQSLEFMGGAVDHFGALIWNPGPSVRLKIRRRTGKVKVLQADRITFAQWSSLSSGNLTAANFKDAVKYTPIGKRAALVSVDTFVNYRQPVDPQTLYGPVFATIQEENRDRLILDLRKNGGGSTDASHGLVANLIEEPLRVKLDMRVKTLTLDGLKEHMRTWDKSALSPDPDDFTQNADGTFSLKPDKSDELAEVIPTVNAFKGQLFILTSDENSSGSTNIMSVLKDAGRATLIGEKTGGSKEGPTAGILLTLELPNSGIRTRIPVFRYKNNVKNFEKGLGLTPDIEVPMTVKAFLNGEDPALEAAMVLAQKT